MLPAPGRGLLPPAASGVLLALAQPPADLWPLAFVGLVPFAVGLAAADPGPSGRRTAVRAGALLGLVYFGLTLSWMPFTLARMAWTAVPGWLLVVGGLAALLAGVGWLIHASLHRLGVPLWAALPVAWTAGEWARGRLPGGLAFPWLELGVSLAPRPELAGGAELVGARGLGFWMAAVAGLLATALLRARAGRGRAWVPAAVAVGVVAAPMAWSVQRADSLPVRPAARVAVVQPGVDVRLRRLPEEGWAATRRAVDSLLAGLEPGDVDLVVLPEVVLRGFPESADGAALLGPFLRAARRLEVPVVFGALGGTGAPEAPRHNSVFVVDPDGPTPFRYDKRRLVPGVERLPLGLGRLVGEGGGYAPGGDAALLEAAGLRHGILICYEAIYPELARDYRRGGADVLLSVTNDGWFGSEVSWPRSSALVQHPAHLVLRAVETRTGVVRAAATGISLYVDPVGRVHEATSMARPALRVHDPGTTDVVTLYVRTGDVVGAGAAALALLLAGLVALRARRARPTGRVPLAG